MTDPRAALAAMLLPYIRVKDQAAAMRAIDRLAERGVLLVTEERLRELADDAGWMRLEDVLAALSAEVTGTKAELDAMDRAASREAGEMP